VLKRAELLVNATAGSKDSSVGEVDLLAETDVMKCRPRPTARLVSPLRWLCLLFLELHRRWKLVRKV